MFTFVSKVKPMFLEKTNKKKGSIEVVCGSMFSGKTEELLRRLRRAEIAQQKVLICKPAVENRYDKNKVVSHDKSSIDCVTVDSAKAILNLPNEIDILGIDEAQFFDNELVDVCNTLANNGVRVIIAALDMDYEGRPFEPIPQLLSIADEVTKVRAICVRCGDLANYSYRIVEQNERILIGEKKEYEARCRYCYHN